MARDVQIDPDQRLPDCPEKAAATTWPYPIDRRLDQLVDAARDAGERTTRKELAAALVFAAQPDGEALGELLKRFRRARARDAVVDSVDGDNVLRLPRHRPGPRAGSR